MSEQELEFRSATVQGGVSGKVFFITTSEEEFLQLNYDGASRNNTIIYEGGSVGARLDSSGFLAGDEIAFFNNTNSPVVVDYTERVKILPIGAGSSINLQTGEFVEFRYLGADTFLILTTLP